MSSLADNCAVDILAGVAGGDELVERYLWLLLTNAEARAAADSFCRMALSADPGRWLTRVALMSWLLKTYPDQPVLNEELLTGLRKALSGDDSEIDLLALATLAEEKP